MSQQDNPNKTNQMPLSETLLQMIAGAWVSQAIYVAAKLGIADLLKDSAKSIDKTIRNSRLFAVRN